MPRYFYKAVKLDGEEVEGEQEAPDEAALVRRLPPAGSRRRWRGGDGGA